MQSFSFSVPCDQFCLYTFRCKSNTTHAYSLIHRSWSFVCQFMNTVTVSSNGNGLLSLIMLLHKQKLCNEQYYGWATWQNILSPFYYIYLKYEDSEPEEFAKTVLKQISIEIDTLQFLEINTEESHCRIINECSGIISLLETWRF